MVWETAVNRHVEIDLGEDWSVLDEHAPAPRLRLNPRWSLLLAVALVLFVGGAAVPRYHQLPQLLRVAGGPRVYPAGVVGDVFVATNESQAIVYRIPGGQLVWQTASNDQGFVTLLRAAGVLITQVLPPSSAADDAAGDKGPTRWAMQAWDVGTGRLLWVATASWVQLDPTSTSLMLYVVNDDRSVDLRMVDPRTGVPRWSRTLAADALVTLPDAAMAGAPLPEVIVGAGDGTVQVLDSVTGRVLRTGYIPQLVDADRADQLSFYVAGDLLMVTSFDATSPYVYAYDLATLRLRWSKTSLDTAQYLGYCGPVLCGQGDVSSLTGFDPRTGDLLWSARTESSWLMPGGLLLVSDNTGGAGHLVDAVTLRHLADLGSWQPIADLGPYPQVFSKPDVERTGTWFGVFDPGTRTVQAVLHTASLAQNCVTEAGLLLCASSDGTITAWRYR